MRIRWQAQPLMDLQLGLRWFLTRVQQRNEIAAAAKADAAEAKPAKVPSPSPAVVAEPETIDATGGAADDDMNAPAPVFPDELVEITPKRATGPRRVAPPPALPTPATSAAAPAPLDMHHPQYGRAHRACSAR